MCLVLYRHPAHICLVLDSETATTSSPAHLWTRRPQLAGRCSRTWGRRGPSPAVESSAAWWTWWRGGRVKEQHYNAGTVPRNSSVWKLDFKKMCTFILKQALIEGYESSDNSSSCTHYKGATEYTQENPHWLEKGCGIKHVCVCSAGLVSNNRPEIQKTKNHQLTQ